MLIGGWWVGGGVPADFHAGCRLTGGFSSSSALRKNNSNPNLLGFKKNKSRVLVGWRARLGHRRFHYENGGPLDVREQNILITWSHSVRAPYLFHLHKAALKITALHFQPPLPKVEGLLYLFIFLTKEAQRNGLQMKQLYAILQKYCRCKVFIRRYGAWLRAGLSGNIPSIPSFSLELPALPHRPRRRQPRRKHYISNGFWTLARMHTVKNTALIPISS